MDRLLGGRVLLEQPQGGYRAAIDPVLLAAVIPAQAGEQVLELGTGAGAASLCLLARIPDIFIVGIEKDDSFAALARRNAHTNKVADRFEIICGDIGAHRTRGPFAHVFCNPPFHDTGLHGEGAVASHMPLENIAAWIGAAFRNLKDKGRFTLIHRADALPHILAALSQQNAGAIKILPVASHDGEPARRVILSAIKGRKTPLELLPPFIVHDGKGGYKPECENILRDAAPLSMGD